MNVMPLPPAAPGRLRDLRGRLHPRCVVCGADHPTGLQVHFEVAADGGVEGLFVGGEVLEGYRGRIHGGVIAALLDAAMTNCLFAHDCEAFTAELVVRYLHPVAPEVPMRVRAWLGESRRTLHLVQAELCQDGQVKVTARGKFLQCHE